MAAGALAGLTVESMILMPIALGILGWYWTTPEGPALAQGWGTALAVAWSGPMTAIPLMMFATAARRMPYTVIGFLQFSSPTIVFLLGVFVFGEELRPAQLIFSGELGPTSHAVLMQSLYSPLLALIGTIVTIPVMLVAALAVKLTSRGPVLYRQTRVGKNGATFTLYKFRSMYADAESKTGAVWAVKDDPRVTPLGRWLRKLRIENALNERYAEVAGYASLPRSILASVEWKF